MPSPDDQNPDDLYIPPFSDNFGEDGFFAQVTKNTCITSRTGEFRVIADLRAIPPTGPVWGWRLYHWDFRNNTGSVCGSGEYFPNRPSSRIQITKGLVGVTVLAQISTWMDEVTEWQQNG